MSPFGIHQVIEKRKASKIRNLHLLFFISLLFSSQLSNTQWFEQTPAVPFFFYDVQFINSNTGFIAGQGGIQRTVNGGENWIMAKNVYYYLFGLFMVNDSVGYTGGDLGAIFRTSNCGFTWDSLTTGIAQIIRCLFFVDSNTGYAAGGNTIIIKTINGGDNWSIQYTLPYDALSSIYFINQSTGWAGGTAGLLKTTNSGNNWFEQLPSNNFFGAPVSIFFLNEFTGYAVTNHVASIGYIIKTTNGGNNWIQLLEHSHVLNSIRFVNDSTSFAAGNYGSILKTTNYGANWHIQNSFTNAGLRSVYFTDNNTGYVVGDYGTILKTTNGGGPVGIEPISCKVPSKFKLYQNYPNPFNGQTIIEFDVSNTDYYRLTVYNVLGQKFEEIVNDYLVPGKYRINYQASGLSSGIYYYSLSSEKHREVKKFVLIK